MAAGLKASLGVAVVVAAFRLVSGAAGWHPASPKTTNDTTVQSAKLMAVLVISIAPCST
jgi:hypothetical protein